MPDSIMDKSSDSVLKRETVNRAKQVIAMKKRENVRRSDKSMY
jgi:hypothetical protein